VIEPPRLLELQAHGGAGAVGREQAIGGAADKPAGALEGGRRSLEIHLETALVEMGADRLSPRRVLEEHEVELVARDGPDRLAPGAVGLDLEAAVDPVNDPAVAGDPDRPHVVARSDPVERGEAAGADRQIDRAPAWGRTHAGIALTVAQVDLEAEIRHERSGHGADQPGSDDEDLFHVRSSHSLLVSRTCRKAPLGAQIAEVGFVARSGADPSFRVSTSCDKRRSGLAIPAARSDPISAKSPPASTLVSRFGLYPKSNRSPEGSSRA